jgi:glyoxylase-like metal-dependent hydrolase (beta-lactamase superfamily II)
MEIHPNILMIKGFASQQYLLKDRNDLILIDAGLQMDANRINKEIEKYISPTFKFKQILITHADGDHYGGVNSILKFHPTTIVRSSELESQAIRSGTSSRQIAGTGCLGVVFKLGSGLFRSGPTPCVGDLVPGMELPILGGLQVLDTSGHTPGHISFFLIKHRILFAGDSILVHGDKLVPSTGANTWDLEKAKKAFEVQMALDPVIIAGGHGWLKRK